MEGHEISPALSIIIGITTLVATIVVGLVGFAVSRAIFFPINRITEIEKIIKKQEDNLFGMRLLAKIILQFSKNIYRSNDTTRRVLGTILENPEILDNKEKLNKIANSYDMFMQSDLLLMPQYYLALELITSDRTEFESALSIFCEMGADIKNPEIIEFSIDFLQGLIGIFDEDHRIRIEEAIAKLKRLRIKNKPVPANWAPSRH